MESLEGYSYYDTPSGPQYIRNDSAESPIMTSADVRRRPSSLSTLNSAKFHPYAHHGRSDKSHLQQETWRDLSATTHTDTPQFARVRDHRTIDPHSLSTTLSRLSSDSSVHDHCYERTQTAEYIGNHHQHQQCIGQVERCARADIDNVAEQHSAFSLSSFRQQDVMNCAFTQPYDPSPISDVQSHARPLHSDSHALVEAQQTNSNGVTPLYKVQSDNNDCLWAPEPAVISTQYMLGAYTSASQSAQQPSQPHLGNNILPIPAFDDTQKISAKTTMFTAVDHTELDEPIQVVNHIQANCILDETASLGRKEFPTSAIVSDLDLSVNEALFEYGPFSDFQMFGTGHDVDQIWAPHTLAGPRADSLISDMQRSPSNSEPDRPVPQVNLVGGYFPPEDDTLGGHPEVNSQGNIRITRLPAKRPVTMYEVPAIPDMTVSQLKAELKKYGLPAIGKKIDLQARLEAHLEQKR